MSLVAITDLKIAFDTGEAVAGINLTIAPGQRVGIVGESGSGKSLLALSIIDLLPETAALSGTIARDTPPGKNFRGNMIAMVFQEPLTALNPLMRVGNQIREVLELHRPGIDFDMHIAQLMKETGLPPVIVNRYPHQLSGGQRQRVCLAIALAGEPKLIIADEPTSALDTVTSAQIIALVRQICDARQMALLFISHDLAAISTLCTHIHVMEKGKLIEQGATDMVLKAPRSLCTRRLIAAAKPTRRPRDRSKTGTPLLIVDNISRRYARPRRFLARGDDVQALERVSLTIGNAECVGLVGPSGSGKTTLSRIIAGLDHAWDGRIKFDGHTVNRRHTRMPKSVRRKLSMVFQDPFGSFDPRRDMAHALHEPFRLAPELGPTERQQRVVSMLTRVGLSPDMLSRYPKAFSGGQRQRFAIARALILRPALVVLDEPVSALDASIRGDILTLLAELGEEFGIACLLVSHDLDVVRAMAHRVLVIDNGRIVEQGRTETVFSAPQTATARQLVEARLTL